nr:hypothetical protein [Chitinispirillaceae bacterium]
MTEQDIAMLESYLLDTRQISGLAVRQAEFFGSEMKNRKPAADMRVAMLLTLAALEKGVPR